MLWAEIKMNRCNGCNKLLWFWQNTYTHNNFKRKETYYCSKCYKIKYPESWKSFKEWKN